MNQQNSNIIRNKAHSPSRMMKRKLDNKLSSFKRKYNDLQNHANENITTDKSVNHNYTNINLLSSLVLGVLLTILSLVFVYILNIHRFSEIIFSRGWIPFVVVFMTMWGLSICFLKYLKLRSQKRIFKNKQLYEIFTNNITPKNIDDITLQLNQSTEKEDFMLVDRIKRCLLHFKASKDLQQVTNFVSNQSGNDAAIIESSYSLLKVFIWAIPILGFIGTVIGISQSVQGFSSMQLVNDSSQISVVGQVNPTDGASQMKATELPDEGIAVDNLKSALGGVTSGLGTAFDTTLLALIMSLVVMFPTSSLQKAEEDQLVMIDDFLNENVICKLEAHPHMDQEEISNSFNELMDKKITPLLQEVRDLLDIAPEKIEMVGSMRNSLSQSFGDLERISQNANHHIEQIENLKSSLEDLTKNTIAFNETIQANQLHFQQNERNVSQFMESMPRITQNLDTVINKLEQSQDTQSTMFSDLSSHFSSMNQELDGMVVKLNETQKEQDKQMTLAKHQFGSNINQFLDSMPLITNSLLIFIDKLEKSQGTQTQMFSSYSSKFNEVNTELNHVLAKLDDVQREQDKKLTAVRYQFGSMLQKIASQFADGNSVEEPENLQLL